MPTFTNMIIKPIVLWIYFCAVSWSFPWLHAYSNTCRGGCSYNTWKFVQEKYFVFVSPREPVTVKNFRMTNICNAVIYPNFKSFTYCLDDWVTVTADFSAENHTCESITSKIISIGFRYGDCGGHWWRKTWSKRQSSTNPYMIQPSPVVQRYEQNINLHARSRWNDLLH